MKSIFTVGDIKQYRKVVDRQDIAAFHGTIVHPVYSTFALARDVEWTTRQFVLEMCDEDEEGVGTDLTIEHKSPAFLNEVIVITGTIERLDGYELICSFKAQIDERLIASGKTGQKILKKEKIEKLFKQP